MNLLISWLVYALAIGASAYLLPGVHIADYRAALVAAIVLALINTFIRPLLILLTLPINILTLGLFTFIINGLLILLAASIVPGFDVDGLLWAVIYGIILSLVSAVLFSILSEPV